VTSLSILVDPKAVDEILTNSRGVFGGGGVANERNSDVLGWVDPRLLARQSLDYHVTRSLWLGCGGAFTLALPLALAWAVWRGGRAARLCAAASLVFLAIVAGSAVRMARYLSPGLPLLALVVAAALGAAARRLGGQRAAGALLAALAVGVAVEPAARAFAFARVASATDTRVLVVDWLRAQHPQGARVAVVGTRIWGYGAPEIGPPFVLTRPAALRPGDLVVTHEHWLGFSRLEPGELDRVAPCRREVARFSPTGPGWAGSVFEAADAFYVPLAGFAGVERPGPDVTVWAVTACEGADASRAL
jgi:hypothetical protein